MTNILLTKVEKLSMLNEKNLAAEELARKIPTTNNKIEALLTEDELLIQLRLNNEKQNEVTR